MTINHLNLVVTDVTKAVEFFTNYFDFFCDYIRGEGVLAVLKNKHKFVLVLMAPQKKENGNSTYPDAFHIGFMLETAEAVDDLHKRLVEGNIEIAQSPRKIRDSYGFYFYFENIFIEVGHYLNLNGEE